MILRMYLFSLYMTLFLAFGLLGFIVFNVNPYTSPYWMLVLFYFTFFLFWLAFFGIIGFYLKIWATNREVIFSHLLPTLRQAVFLSLAIVGVLFLWQIKALSWWVAALFVLAIGLVELYFRKR